MQVLNPSTYLDYEVTRTKDAHDAWQVDDLAAVHAVVNHNTDVMLRKNRGHSRMATRGAGSPQTGSHYGTSGS